MSFFNLVKKNIVFSYIIFGMLIFIILFSLNFIYKKYFLSLDLGYKYDVVGNEYSGYKKKTFHTVIADVVEDLKNIHRIKNVKVESPGLTLKERKSTLSLRLILNDFVDEKKLENMMNKKYLNSINEVIGKFEKYSYLYDYQKIEKSYKKFRSLEIEKAFDELTNSNLFKEYPPQLCYESTEYCLNVYADFYTFIFEILQNGNQDFKKFLNNENISFSETYRNFNLNRYLFDSEKIQGLLSEDIKSAVRVTYFEEKFEILINSDFYKNYSFNYCMTYENDCLINISEEFKKILYEHKIESQNLYDVKFIASDDRDKIKLLPVAIKVIGFSILITYVLYLLTNKFFREKVK